MKDVNLRRRSARDPRRSPADWSRFDALTDEQVKAAIHDDPDAPPIIDADWLANAKLVVPEPKVQISIRLDRDVLDHFRKYPRYQTRINAILRSVMEHEATHERPRAARVSRQGQRRSASDSGGGRGSA